MGDLVANLGGALSLWLGISIAMFLEVLEFIIDIIIVLCTSNTKKKNDTTDTKDVDARRGVFDVLFDTKENNIK